MARESIRPIRLFLSKYIQKLIQFSKTSDGSLAVIWGNRMIALVFMTNFFIRNLSNFTPDEMAVIRLTLLVFFGYQTLMGFLGITFRDWFLLSPLKFSQITIEIVLYTLLLYFSKDPSSDIYLCYFFPVLVGFTYLHRSDNSFINLSFLPLALSIAGLFGATYLLAQKSALPFPVFTFGSRAIFLILISVIYVIHKRTSLANELRKEDPQLLNMLSTSPQGFFLTDLDGTLLFANDQLQERYGSYQKGQPYQAYFHSENCALFPQNADTQTLSELKGKQTCTFLALNGEQDQVEVHYSSVLEEDGDLIRIAQVLRSDSSLQHLEEKLTQVQNKLDQTTAREKSLNANRRLWLKTYQELGKKMISWIRIEELLQFLVDEAMQRTYSEACILLLRDGEQLKRVAVSGIDASRLSSDSYPIAEGTPLLVNILKDGKNQRLLQVKDQIDQSALTKLSYLKQYINLLPGRRLQHVLEVPLHTSEDLIGMIWLINPRDELAAQRSSDDDNDFLSTFTSMAAIAIQNIRLLEEKNVRLREIEALYQIGDSIAKARDYDALLHTLGMQAHSAFSQSFKTKFLLLTSEGNSFSTEFASSPSEDIDHLPALSKFEGIAGQAIFEKRTICCQDTSKSVVFVRRGPRDPAALICVPMMSAEESFGVLNISSQAPNVFHPNHIRMAEALADQASIAIEKFRLLDKQRKRAEQAEAIRLVAQKVSECRDEKDLYPVALDELAKIIPFDGVSIWRVCGSVLRIVDYRGFDDHKKMHKLRIPTNDPQYPNHRVLHEKKSIIINDVRDQYPVFKEKQDTFQSGNIRSWMGTPIILDGKVIRMVCFDHSSPNKFGEDEAVLAQTIAMHIAIAIKNTLLNRKEKRATERLSQLYEISQKISKSLDTEEVLMRIVNSIHSLLQASHTGIVLLDPDGSAKASIESRNIGKPLHERIRSDGVTQKIFKTGRPIYYDYVDGSREHNPLVLAEHFRSYAGIPIKAAGRVVAVLFVHSKTNKHFSKYNKLLMTFGSQAGIAIEHADLYQRERQQKVQLDNLVTFSQGLIQHVELDSAIQYAVAEGGKLFQVEDCSIFITDYDRKTVDLRASNVVPVSIWEHRDAYLDKPGLTAFVARTGEPLNLAGTEISSHPNWGGYLGHLNYLPSKSCHSLSLNALPDSQGKNLGVLKFENRLEPGEGKRFPAFETTLQKSFAALVGLAIERARIYAKLDIEARSKVMKALAREMHALEGLLLITQVTNSAKAKNELNLEHWSEVGSIIDDIHKSGLYLYEQLDEFRRGLDSGVELTPTAEGLTLAIYKYNAKYLHLPLSVQTRGRGNLPINIRHGLYKTAIEAMANIKKHTAEGTQVWIEILRYESGYCFMVRDNGQGFDVTKAEEQDISHGLKNMRTYTDEIKANYQIQSEINQGTTIRVTGLIVEEEKENGKSENTRIDCR